MHPPAVASPSDALWRTLTASTPDSENPYGFLRAPDSHGLALPDGFTSRVVARSGQPVGGTSWHAAPDGGACFPDGSGWIYVSNSEIPLAGGASAIRFGPDGTVKDAYRILGDTNLNRTGCPTPWGSWLSCEDILLGRVHETDPFGRHHAQTREGLGRFAHSAVVCDTDSKVVYLTEDETDGCFYRFIPDTWGDLATGRLEVMRAIDGVAEWLPVPMPAPGFGDAATRRQIDTAHRFNRATDCRYEDGKCFFTADGVAWVYDAGRGELTSMGNRQFAGSAGMDVYVITCEGVVAPVARLCGHEASEITGAAFSPDGSRLYFSSQRGTSGSSNAGVTYEVTGPF